MPASQKEISLVQQNSQCLLAEADLDGMLDELAVKITAECEHKNPVILCVMTGAVVVVGLLMPRLNFPLELDYIHATRYRGGVTGNELEWKSFPTTPLQGRVVLIIDDVLDQGVTMKALLDYCKKQGANSCYSAVLVNKNLTKQKPVQADFVGLEAGEQYIYGLGMDYKGYLRNIKGIYACPENLEEMLCQRLE